MKVKCRKVTAALLSCILAFLSLAAELSHHHGLPAHGTLSVQAEQSGKASGKVGVAHNYSCVACQFAVTHFAVLVVTAIKVAALPTSLSTHIASVVDSQFSFQFSSLRAPPAVLA